MDNTLLQKLHCNRLRFSKLLQGSFAANLSSYFSKRIRENNAIQQQLHMKVFKSFFYETTPQWRLQNLHHNKVILRRKFDTTV